MRAFLFVVLTLFVSPKMGMCQDSLDWLLIYYVPYDNNLSAYADSVVEQLESARQFENVQVVLQIDKSDSLGMYRYTINKTETSIDTISSEESTSQKQLQSYLKWASKSFNFRNSAVFFLDHGGALNEVGQDLQPDSTFLTAQSIRKALTKFNKWNRSTIDLVYLQVCAKAALAPLYELHETVEYTLASQMLLGAPNYYYYEVVKYLSENPRSSGVQLAEVIATKDRQDMITSLTCIDNSKFEIVRSSFRKLVNSLEGQPPLQFTKAPLHFDYASDRYWDVIDFLAALDLHSKTSKACRKALYHYISIELICYKYDPTPTQYSGISIASLSKDRIRKYWGMRFYRDFQLHKLPIQ